MRPRTDGASILYVMRSMTAAVILMAAGACASDPQKIKEGLWEVRGESTENPGGRKITFAYKLCRDHALDRQANAALKNVQGCHTVIKNQGDGKYASASTCDVAGTSIVSNGVTTYNNQESTHSETQAQYTPPFRGKSDEVMTQDQHYIGACPAGVKPGDTIGPDGIVYHHSSLIK
jgi:hypothetical protein